MTKLVITVIAVGLLLTTVFQGTGAEVGQSPLGQPISYRIWIPVGLVSFPPEPSISRYIAKGSQLNNSALYELGCNRGQETLPGQDVVIILDFGYPRYDTQSSQYGVM